MCAWIPDAGSTGGRRQNLAAARGLADSLAAGGRPRSIAVDWHLQPGETCYLSQTAQVFQLLEGEGSYVHKTSIGYGFVGLAFKAGTAAGNRARERRAAAEAAARFRLVEQGPMYLTDRRFSIQGGSQWIDLWYDNVRVSNCDGEAISMEVANLPPIQLRVWAADYWYVLFRWLAHGEVVRLPPS